MGGAQRKLTGPGCPFAMARRHRKELDYTRHYVHTAPWRPPRYHRQCAAIGAAIDGSALTDDIDVPTGITPKIPCASLLWAEPQRDNAVGRLRGSPAARWGSIVAHGWCRGLTTFILPRLPSRFHPSVLSFMQYMAAGWLCRRVPLYTPFRPPGPRPIS